MPEFNHRVVTLGMKEAQEEFQEAVRQRLLAETSSEQLERELRELDRAAKESLRAAEQARRG